MHSRFTGRWRGAAGGVEAIQNWQRAALWSQDPPDAEFMHVMEAVFSRNEAHVVPFFNPFQNGEATNTIYVGVRN